MPLYDVQKLITHAHQLLVVIFIVSAVSAKLNLVEENMKKMLINDFSLSEEGMKMLFCYHDYADCYK